MENLNEPNNNFKYIQFPENKKSLQNEIRFNMQFCRANKLNQTAKWLGELLVKI